VIIFSDRRAHRRITRPKYAHRHGPCSRRGCRLWLPSARRSPSLIYATFHLHLHLLQPRGLDHGPKPLQSSIGLSAACGLSHRRLGDHPSGCVRDDVPVEDAGGHPSPIWVVLMIAPDHRRARLPIPTPLAAWTHFGGKAANGVVPSNLVGFGLGGGRGPSRSSLRSASRSTNLRFFLPPKTADNRPTGWWSAVLNGRTRLGRASGPSSRWPAGSSPSSSSTRSVRRKRWSRSFRSLAATRCSYLAACPRHRRVLRHPVPDQDQCDQRLLGLAVVVQLFFSRVFPHTPRAGGVDLLQRSASRWGLMEGGVFGLSELGARVLLQRGHRLDRRRRG